MPRVIRRKTIVDRCEEKENVPPPKTMPESQADAEMEEVNSLPVKAIWEPGSKPGTLLLKHDGHAFYVKKNEGGPHQLFSYFCSKNRKEGCEVRLTYSKVIIDGGFLYDFKFLNFS